jgi:hypothetical protein
MTTPRSLFNTNAARASERQTRSRGLVKRSSTIDGTLRLSRIQWITLWMGQGFKIPKVRNFVTFCNMPKNEAEAMCLMRLTFIRMVNRTARNMKPPIVSDC